MLNPHAFYFYIQPVVYTDTPVTAVTLQSSTSFWKIGPRRQTIAAGEVTRRHPPRPDRRHKPRSNRTEPMTSFSHSEQTNVGECEGRHTVHTQHHFEIHLQCLTYTYTIQNCCVTNPFHKYRASLVSLFFVALCKYVRHLV